MHDVTNSVAGARPHVRKGFVRLVVALAVIAVAFAVALPTAGASARSRIEGSVAGQAPFDFGSGCSFVHQRFLTVVDINHGPHALLLIDGCVDITDAGVEFTGSFIFAAPSGTLSGSATGQGSATASNVSFDFSLTIAQGTKGFGHSSGALHVSVVWVSNMVDGGPVTGDITASVT